MLKKNTMSKRNIIFLSVSAVAVVAIVIFIVCFIRYSENGSSSTDAPASSEAAESGYEYDTVPIVPSEPGITDEVTVKHLVNIDIIYPDDYFNNQAISQPDSDVTCITLKGDNAVSVLYVAELYSEMLVSGFSDYILAQYSDIIKETYGTSTFTEYAWDSEYLRRYELSDLKTALIYTGDTYALYMEVVTDGSEDSIKQALSFIRRK